MRKVTFNARNRSHKDENLDVVTMLEIIGTLLVICSICKLIMYSL